MAVTATALVIGVAGVARHLAAAEPLELPGLQQALKHSVGTIHQLTGVEEFWTAVALAMSAASLVLPWRIG